MSKYTIEVKSNRGIYAYRWPESRKGRDAVEVIDRRGNASWGAHELSWEELAHARALWERSQTKRPELPQGWAWIHHGRAALSDDFALTPDSNGALELECFRTRHTYSALATISQLRKVHDIVAQWQIDRPKGDE